MSSDWREGKCSAVKVSKSPFKSPRTSSFPKISIFRMSVKTAFRNMAVMAATQGAPRLVPWASSERGEDTGLVFDQDFELLVFDGLGYR